MKRLLSLSFISLGVLLAPVFAAQAAFTNQPNITNVERTGEGPFPVLVEWELSSRATDGVVVNDRITVELRQDGTGGTSIGSVDLAADATSLSISRDQFPNLKTHAKYGVVVTEVRDDDTEKYDTDTLYTGPPKLKRIKVKDVENASFGGTVNGTLRWLKPSSLNGESVRYVYQVRRNGKKKTLIKEGSVTGDINSISLTGLPHTKMMVRVRVEDSVTKYGVGKWSAWKKFKAPAAE